MKASDRRILAQLGSPAPDAQVAEAIAEQKEQARDLEQRAERVDVLVRTIESYRNDLARFHAQHAQLAELGDGHVEMPMRSYHDALHMEIVWEPVRSLEPASVLAERVAAKIADAEATIAAKQREIEELLAEPKAKRRRFRFREPAAS